ncbi:tyrosine-type recombinase/integrase [Streptomyces massasporeus]|uniref:tyrosine-type recombinase/integrase n=1 Tax=Streptomyces massasporeus TaxID=67324 RepID=UPI00364B98CC
MSRNLGLPPRLVTPQHLTHWFAANAHWKPETRRGYRNSVVLFFRWAHKEGHLEVDPAADIPTVKPDQAAPRPAPDRVWKASLMRAHPRTMIMLRLAAEAGMRRAEVAQVHTRDLLEGFDGYQLLVHGKGGKERIVPISDDLADLILAGPAGHTPEMAAFGTEGFLFPGDEDGHLSARWVGKLCANAMPEGWTMHTLRHRFATRAFRGSRNIRAVQKLLGHSNVAVTERYTAVDDAEVRAAMMAAASDGPNRVLPFINPGIATVVTAAASVVFAVAMFLSVQSETHTDADASQVVCYSDWNSVSIHEALTAANDPRTRLEVGNCDGVVV